MEWGFGMEERRAKRRQARMRRARQRRQRSHIRQNKLGMLCVSAVVLCLLAAFSIQIFRLYGKNEDYKIREEELTRRLEQEQERSEEIAAYQEYVASPEYIEELARARLGLVHSDEIIFKEERQDE